mmetsp:Transcript_1744/g.5750  ORF Transcript_1744/g.5750 Transcript_1744/m.5750 type:complete len:80 (+) Transcript_1744:640-879(+)
MFATSHGRMDPRQLVQLQHQEAPHGLGWPVLLADAAQHPSLDLRLVWRRLRRWLRRRPLWRLLYLRRSGCHAQAKAPPD